MQAEEWRKDRRKGLTKRRQCVNLSVKEETNFVKKTFSAVRKAACRVSRSTSGFSLL